MPRTIIIDEIEFNSMEFNKKQMNFKKNVKNFIRKNSNVQKL